MKDELKPCPFCGKIPELKRPKLPYDTGHPMKIIQCECGAFLNATRWNNRPIEDALTKRAEAAEAEANALYLLMVDDPKTKKMADEMLKNMRNIITRNTKGGER